MSVPFWIYYSAQKQTFIIKDIKLILLAQFFQINNLYINPGKPAAIKKLKASSFRSLESHKVFKFIHVEHLSQFYSH